MFHLKGVLARGKFLSHGRVHCLGPGRLALSENTLIVAGGGGAGRAGAHPPPTSWPLLSRDHPVSTLRQQQQLPPYQIPGGQQTWGDSAVVVEGAERVITSEYQLLY